MNIQTKRIVISIISSKPPQLWNCLCVVYVLHSTDVTDVRIFLTYVTLFLYSLFPLRQRDKARKITLSPSEVRISDRKRTRELWWRQADILTFVFNLIVTLLEVLEACAIRKLLVALFAGLALPKKGCMLKHGCSVVVHTDCSSRLAF